MKSYFALKVIANLKLKYKLLYILKKLNKLKILCAKINNFLLLFLKLQKKFCFKSIKNFLNEQDDNTTYKTQIIESNIEKAVKRYLYSYLFKSLKKRYCKL